MWTILFYGVHLLPKNLSNDVLGDMSIHKAKSIPHGFNDLGMIFVYVGQTSFENYSIFLVSLDFGRYYEG